MGSDAQMQDRNLQVTEELGMLKDAVSSLTTRTESVEARLQKVMTSPPITDQEGKKGEEESLCDIANRICNSRREVTKANRLLQYIEENLQL